MKLVNYSRNNLVSAGILKEDKIFSLSEPTPAIQMEDLHDSRVTTIDDILSEGLVGNVRALEKDVLRDANREIPVKDVKLLTPVLNPEKIYCVAFNYKSHGKESGMKPPSEPYFFTKFRNTLVATNDPVTISISSKLDWEAELAVIIGKPAKNIPRSEAMEYIAGYTVANDISCRDLQLLNDTSRSLGPNWVKGKGLDTSLPLGPCLVTREEIMNPYDCEISLSVNGVQKQSSKAENMIFKIDEMIEYLSRGTTLKPGDVICTGTPEGVAAYSGDKFLADGDILETSINGIGTLRNPIMK